MALIFIPTCNRSVFFRLQVGNESTNKEIKGNPEPRAPAGWAAELCVSADVKTAGIRQTPSKSTADCLFIYTDPVEARQREQPNGSTKSLAAALPPIRA